MIRSFECGVRGVERTSVIQHVSAAKAKYEFWRMWCEVLNPVDSREIWKKLTCRVLGGPVQTEAFRHTASYRGLTFARIGMKVQVGDEKHGIWNGYIVDRNNSANFNVYFEDGPHKGVVLNCHPRWMMKYFDTAGNLLFDSAASSMRGVSA